MNNPHVTNARSLVTTPEARRSGFLEYALRRNVESLPFIDDAKALKYKLETETQSAADLLTIRCLGDTLLTAAGLSTKAKAYLTEDDQSRFLNEFIDNVLLPTGTNYIEEVLFRYLLTKGDALGGVMRNITGKIAEEKFTRFLIANLNITGSTYFFSLKDDHSGSFVASENFDPNDYSKIKAIQWQPLNQQQWNILFVNKKVPMVKKNYDIIVMKRTSEDGMLPSAKSNDTTLREMNTDPAAYVTIGELKGGYDPAGADEHWKTANSGLDRVRNTFEGQLPLFFVGNAIESSMSEEIFRQYQNGNLSNCANLSVDNQLAALCSWVASVV
jgi:hypothetical protein